MSLGKVIHPSFNHYYYDKSLLKNKMLANIVHMKARRHAERANAETEHRQKQHYEELLVSNHPRLFPIITISFNNNHIKWQDEILHDDT